MDADVRFKGRRIEHGGTLPISDLSTHVILEDGDLRLQPVRFGLANGSIAGSVHLQGDKKPLQGEANLQARRLKLKALMPNVEMMQKTLGEMNGDVQLRGSGNSVAALLGNSNGNLKLLMNDGLISRNLMEILGLNVGNYLIGQIFGDEEVRVNCGQYRRNQRRRPAADFCLRYRKRANQCDRDRQLRLRAAGPDHRSGKQRLSGDHPAFPAVCPGHL